MESNVRLSIKSLAVTSGALWGGCMLTCGLLRMAAPSYANGFLKLMSSVYPGFHNSRKLPDVLVGAGYGVVDGAVGGIIFGLLYNYIAGGGTKPETRAIT
jgi:hypothetical protein